MQRMPYLSDPKLIPRVQKYIEEKVDRTYVDIALMADELQNTYREYSRRKRNAFRASVKKAYSIVLRSYGLEDQNDCSSDKEVEEAEDGNSREGHFQGNLMNNQLVDLYSRSSMNAPKMNDNELIDICSDDSKEESQPPLAKSSKLIGPDFSSNASNNILDNVERCEKLTVMQGKKQLDDITVLQVKKKKKTESVPENAPKVPNVDFNDVVGIDSTIKQLSKILSFLHRPFSKSIITKSILLHGPSGCGKTLLARAIAGYLDYPLIEVYATDLVSGISGESEKSIKRLFEKGISSAPCVIFIDEIDILTNSQSNSQKDMHKRMISQLKFCLDELNQLTEKVILIAATSNPSAMDPSLKTYGRFSNEIRLGIPKEKTRIAILKKYATEVGLEAGFDWKRVGAVTPGFVGADLTSLSNAAANLALVRFLNSNANYLIKSRKVDPKEPLYKNNDTSGQEENLVLVIEDENSKQGTENISSSTVPTEANNSVEPMPTEAVTKENEVAPESVKDAVDSSSSSEWNWTDEEIQRFARGKIPIPEGSNKSIILTVDDYLQAAKLIKPASIREGLLCIPNITWNDVGSLKDIKEELMSAILGATRDKIKYQRLRITTPAGILLCGPPGCGKTLVAKALANEARINFISVKGPELLNMYVGESEKAVRMCFERAKNSAPCVIFFDELDALCPRRSSDREGDVSSRVVNQMLTEMDGFEDREGVYLLAATNKPDRIDPAVLRPGRLDKILYVGLPSAVDRLEILKTITDNFTWPRISPEVNLEDLCNSDKLSGYTGADLSQLVKEAGLVHCRRTVNVAVEDYTLTNEDFDQAIAKIRPSVSEKDRAFYREMKKQYTPRGKNEVDEEMDLS